MIGDKMTILPIDGLVEPSHAFGKPRGLYNYQDKYLLAVIGERLCRLDRLDDCIKATHLFDVDAGDKYIDFSEMPNGNVCLSDGWKHWILNPDANTLKEVKI